MTLPIRALPPIHDAGQLAGARSFARSLSVLADIAESNADAALDQRLSDAYTDVARGLGEIVLELGERLDTIEGVRTPISDPRQIVMERVG